MADAAPEPLYPLLRGSDVAAQAALSSDLSVDHLVIGAGAVGLAIARELTRRWPERTTYLVERHQQPGQETSSRNSEVIHAGLYYPKDSLKTRMCIRGRDLMYEYCSSYNVPHKQIGKLVVGPSNARSYFESMLRHVSSLEPSKHRPELTLISGDEARELEPELSKGIGAAVFSPRTGIVSSHEYMESLEKEVMDSEIAEIVYDTSVLKVEPILVASASSNSSSKRGASSEDQGWIVHMRTGESNDVDTLRSKVVINSAGLTAPAILNGLLRDGHFGSAPKDWAREGSGESVDDSSRKIAPLAAYYSKGNYASYKGQGARHVKHLIYPTPFGMDQGGDPHKHQGLGTHLTIDLNGGIKFGPDTEWLHPPRDASPDFWSSSLAPLTRVPHSHQDADQESRLDLIHQAVQQYLPDVLREGLSPDYAGIRPKLVPPGAAFRDFGVLLHHSNNLERQRIWQEALTLGAAQDGAEHGSVNAGGTMITLAGIESPGLTSSLAIAELVGDLVGRRAWAHDDHHSKAAAKARARTGKGSADDATSSANVDAWA
ncbi:FAD dependent oxidoreductase [Ceraceosorus guamensis]|uniref:L-2-hydroxyglutarate dehydrogenase, mitochondrial n=1 Tax=Ceraceosorus guamensis TaxID=1522189 RepID=A0A316W136_9BASI|nr:FAD dependent oxidoreductase [Ceraceosorus guamensis]PWN42453.1 FAD dependent oxidoreductase [Ceraceosorus guamensis]